MSKRKLGLGKIMRRYVASAAGVALIVLLANALIGAALLMRLLASAPGIFQAEIQRIADGLRPDGEQYAFDGQAAEIYDRWYIWAMLLDRDGTVIWSQDLPDEIPLEYSAAEIAQFTRWFLKNYPVTVWRHGDSGLLVLGSKQGSIAKYNVNYPVRFIEGLVWWLPVLLILNILVSILLALFMGYRMFRSIRPVAAAISDLAQQKPVALPTGGLLGDLSHMLNQTSGELQRQRAMLEKRDQTRTEWIAGISHDIRTPLSMVMGYAGQLEEAGALTEEHRKQAFIIRVQSQRIKELITNLNLASRLEYGWKPLEKKPVLLASLLRAVAADAINAGLGERHTITVEIDEAAANAQILGDGFLLRRAVQNLLDNSIRHNKTECQIRLSLNCIDEKIVLTVEDNGVGMPDETAAWLQGGNDVKNKKYGMGLSIVTQITQAHGGSVCCDNRSPKGCAIKLCWPLMGFEG